MPDFLKPKRTRTNDGCKNDMEDNAESNHEARAIIAEAIKIVVEMSSQETDGKWLEKETVKASPHIKEWDVAECWLWDEWPERKKHFPNSTKQDVGIDVVAKRRDGEYIAIQCKARKLDEQGAGNPIPSGEIDKFVGASANSFWAELWLVTNGANPLSRNAQSKAGMSDEDRPIKLINIKADLDAQQKKFDDEDRAASEHCAHCENPEDANAVQTKNCMQNEAIDRSVRILKEHAQSDSGGLPIGQARGRIILPCGTGKTRISLRIVEDLTLPGKLSIVLCPSIALVAQIRREYLQNAKNPIRPLAVCSDETAGYDPKKEDKRNTAEDPTLDNSNTSADVIKGKVSTNPADIKQWIEIGQKKNQISVIFGTYQSGRALADALKQANAKACVLIADEAHRTAGLRRTKRAKNSELSKEEQGVRDFTLCHDNEEMPATYRVYQTATPRIYDLKKTKAKLDQSSDWIVRSMDDEQTFGVELYRKSYLEAVNNQWLSDYRIIALGVNDREAYEQANKLARETESKGKQRLSTSHYLRGMAFALAMGGEVENENGAALPIQSCIAFMNTVDKSKNMAKDLQADAVREWIKNRQKESIQTSPAADNFKLEHLDASSNVTKREEAKSRLAKANPNNPHGIINVGIFGEGTDSPSLSAVAFLESRKSPIDVVQAVGRAMRTSPGKQMGYIICPILIPPSADPENWIMTSNPEGGWKELGQILLALRAHDNRIEDELKDLLHLYLPTTPPPKVKTFHGITTGKEENRRTAYREYEGKPGEAQKALERVLKGESSLSKEKFQSLPQSYPAPNPNSKPAPNQPTEPSQIMTGKRNNDGNIELRIDDIQRDKPATEETLGKVNIEKSKKKAHAMINKGEGQPLTPSDQKPKRRTAKEAAEQRMLNLIREEELLKAITMNLLAKSGLTDNRIQRDLNLLEDSVKEAARHLKEDQLQPALDRHFELDNIKEEKRKQQADGCTIAALLMMNAAMLHQRIADGKRILKQQIISLNKIKNDPNPIRIILRQWNAIIGHDFKPVLQPAVDAIHAIEDTGKLAGLERALRHLASEAERIADTYANMGADHAGPLFNKVMGNQASDGAFFTRPPAADIACRLTIDLLEEHPPNHLAFTNAGKIDWTSAITWRGLKTMDPAVGSGILLAAMIAEFKRRARTQLRQSAQEEREAIIASLQKIAVEETMIGMDINPVSLQLAAAQLCIGNPSLNYQKMRLHLMPYGPQPNGQVKAGTLELLSQKAIVQRTDLNLPDENLQTKQVWESGQDEDPEMSEAVKDATNCQIVIANPPFTNRVKMGEKFHDHLRDKLRSRVDGLEQTLVDNDLELEKFTDKRALRPLFVALAEKCANRQNGIFTMFSPTIAVSSPSGKNERCLLAKRFHIHTIFTVHCPGDNTMSQDVAISESILILQKRKDPKPPTRIINLDKFPQNEEQLQSFFESLEKCKEGELPKDWGNLSFWPRERIERGDWTAAIWRNPELAEAAAQFAEDESLKTLRELGISSTLTTPILTVHFERCEPNIPGSLPSLDTSGADGQTTIQSQPDSYWVHKKRNQNETAKLLAKAGHLLLTFSQDASAARLTSVAESEKYVGRGWMTVEGLTADQAKALAVFLNSTAGRLQLMRNAGRKLSFPMYSPAGIANIRVPDVIKDGEVCRLLKECWEDTRHIKVPQYRDGDDWDGKNHPRLKIREAKLAEHQNRKEEWEERNAGNANREKGKAERGAGKEEIEKGKAGESKAERGAGKVGGEFVYNPRPLWDACVARAMKKNRLFRLRRLNRLRSLLHIEPHIRGKSYNEHSDATEED